jgi:hypothetical protein
MKRIIDTHVHRLLLACFAAILMLMSACEKDMIDPPVISGVLNYAASPNDTVVHTIQTGQWVVLTGRSLSGVTQVYFGSVPATINSTFFTDESIVVQLPDIPFQSVLEEDLNIVTAISEGGVATYNINIIGEPIISFIRNYAESPDDTIVNVLYPGDQINIVGYNLKDATSVSFQGIAADLTNVVYSDTSAVLQVPVDLSGSDATLANTITYTTAIGEVGFPIKIVGPPVISSVSYEIPKEGDQVSIYGYNFVSIQSLTFAGMPITSYEVSSDESTIEFIAPALTQSGPVEIITLGGEFTTTYNVNDVLTGIVSDFEWGDNFHWDWWGGASLASDNADFPGNSGQYLTLITNILDSGAGDEWSTAIRMGGVQWLPAESLADPVSNWALKFEINVSDPWNGGTLCIKSSNGNYMARYEPWQISSTKAVPYTTNGWQTVTIPLSAFRKNDAALGDGKGEPITSITELVGATGTSDMILYMHNYSADATKTNFNAAFDNFRVVRR